MDAPNLSRLRRQVRRFLWDNKARKAARAMMIRRVIEQGWDACLFGGTIRDIVLRGPWARTRDVDIVVANVGTDDLAKAFAGLVARRTRFGGLHVVVDGWKFDIWPLHETWAFSRQSSQQSSFDSLPKTTFLTVESVVVQLNVKSGVPRRVFEHRFFESVQNRVIEINLAENPYPALSVVRTFVTARRLDFMLGPRLTRFIAERLNQFSNAELFKSQLEHYKRPILTQADLEMYRKTVLSHVERLRDEPLPLPMPRQLYFPWKAPEPIEQVVAEAVDAEADLVSV